MDTVGPILATLLVVFVSGCSAQCSGRTRYLTATETVQMFSPASVEQSRYVNCSWSITAHTGCNVCLKPDYFPIACGTGLLYIYDGPYETDDARITAFCHDGWNVCSKGITLTVRWISNDWRDEFRCKYTSGTESSPCSRDTTTSTTNNSTPKPDGSSVFRNPWFWANITFTCICFLSFSVCACLKHRQVRLRRLNRRRAEHRAASSSPTGPSTVEGSEGARYNMAFFGYADQPPSYSSVVKVKAEGEEEETSLRELPPSYDEAIVMWPPPQTAL